MKELNNEQLHLVRQWFDSVQDANPDYLEQADYSLAKEIYLVLGMRVPDSIERNVDTAEVNSEVIRVTAVLELAAQANVDKVASEGDFSLKLINAANKIKHGGTLVVPPALNAMEFKLIVKWVLPHNEFYFSQIFDMAQIEEVAIDTFDLFVQLANQAVEVEIESQKPDNS